MSFNTTFPCRKTKASSTQSLVTAMDDVILDGGTQTQTQNNCISTVDLDEENNSCLSTIHINKDGSVIDLSKVCDPVICLSPGYLRKVCHPVLILECADEVIKKERLKEQKSNKMSQKGSEESPITLETSEEEGSDRESSPEYIPIPKKRKNEGSSDDIRSDSDSPIIRRKNVVAEGSDDEDVASSKSDSDYEESSEEVIPKPRSSKRRRIVFDSEDSDESPEPEEDEIESPRKKYARKMIEDKDLQQATIDAEQAEKERKERLIQRQKEFNGIEFQTTPSEDGTSLVTKLKRIVLDDDSKSDNSPKPVEVNPKIVRYLKNYQSDGIKFMFQNTIESLERFRKGDPGGGGILAHCMGLGKTLQTISFIHTVLSHRELSQKISKVLIVVPKNVVLNWRNEFNKWLVDNHHSLDTFDVMELDSFKTDQDRLMCLRNWHNNDTPSVMIIGYDMFRILVQSEDDKVAIKKSKQQPKKPTHKQTKFKKLQVEFRKLLQDPGPDLVVCDEAHKLKNNESILAKTMVKIKTRRRICLTGTPLQNNLKEYYVMIAFVKPGLLGTKAEFDNRFANIIEKGRTKDASDFEVRLMKKRCHVLFEQLKDVVQRKDIAVLKQEIPGKSEYVLKVRLTPVQAHLYQQFLDLIGIKDKSELGKRLLPDYHVFSRIWTHPIQLEYHQEELERKNLLNDDLDDFIDDGEESLGSCDTDVNDDDDEEDLQQSNGIRHSDRLAGRSPSKSPTDLIEHKSGWWSNEVDSSSKFNLEMSNKLVILMDIIKRCEAIGDKLLVFSQSLESLRLIRLFLEHFDNTDNWFVDGHECLAAGNEKWGWKRNRDYMVIDGSINSRDRESIQNKFNSKNLQARLMLISTRAGSLGTNMVAANRVVIFDSCWNPSHDTQSLFRVYRIGQTKPVYIYRLVAAGTMEECIYKRQVTKDSTALRVIDEAQIQRHFQASDLRELYQLNYTPYDPDVTISKAPPKDRLLGDLLLAHPDAVIDYVFHDNLFENLDDEKLTEEETKEAWDEYERDKNNRNLMNRILNPGGVSNGGASIGLNGLYSQPRPLLAPNTLININGAHVFNSTTIDPSFAPALPSDPVFNMAILKGLNFTQATKCAMIKLMLHALLNVVPANLKNGVNEFGSIICSFLNGNEEQEVRTWKVIELYQTMIAIFNRDPRAKQLIDSYHHYCPWLTIKRLRQNPVSSIQQRNA